MVRIECKNCCTSEKWISQKLIYPTSIAIILDYGKTSYVSDIALCLCRLWLYLHALAKKYKFGNMWTLKRVEEPLRQQVNIEMVLLIKLWFNMSSWTQWHTVPHYVIFFIHLWVVSLCHQHYCKHQGMHHSYKHIWGNTRLLHAFIYFIKM